MAALSTIRTSGPEKFRAGLIILTMLITDLSFPLGQSVNNGIDPSLCSLVYTTISEVASLAATLGRRALLAKIDIKAVPADPSAPPRPGSARHAVEGQDLHKPDASFWVAVSP